MGHCFDKFNMGQQGSNVLQLRCQSSHTVNAWKYSWGSSAGLTPQTKRTSGTGSNPSIYHAILLLPLRFPSPDTHVLSRRPKGAFRRQRRPSMTRGNARLSRTMRIPLPFQARVARGGCESVHDVEMAAAWGSGEGWRMLYMKMLQVAALI